MHHKVPLGVLGIGSVIDLCALNREDPPLSFKDDFKLPTPADDLPPSYYNPKAEPQKLGVNTYWGGTPGL